MKATLGPELEAAKSRGGGFSRVEPSGTQFLHSICKLTHIGRKQYAKGNVLLTRFLELGRGFGSKVKVRVTIWISAELSHLEQTCSRRLLTLCR